MPDRSVVNLSGYRFVVLDALEPRRQALQHGLGETGVRGTVLLAAEGINVALAGSVAECAAARAVLDADSALAGLWLKESRSDTVPFARLKVRLRNEIIAFDGEDAIARQAARPAAASLAPETLAAWLEAGRDITLLDTRNAYEVASGTFVGARHLDLEHFGDFDHAARAAIASGRLDPDRPVVTFCTGGVRCEKAAPWLREHGFREVWQIEGGVLNWFERCGDAHWEGNCFVFDARVEIDARLAPTGATFCPKCQRAVPADRACRCASGRPAPAGAHRDDATDGANPDPASDAATLDGSQASRTAIDTV